MEKKFNQINDVNRARRARPRMLQVGQTWSAVYMDKEGRIPGYTFKLLYEDNYWCIETQTIRKCWLGLKMYNHPNPHKQEAPSCWWFDDIGSCTDISGDFQFLLSRKKRLSNE